MLTLTFLGTSAGMPTKQRNVTALAVSLVNPYSKAKNTPWLLVDCGEGTQQQILHTPLSLLNLEAILITHVHGDHCYGLPGLLSSMGMNRRTAPLKIIAPQAIGKLLDTLTITTELYFPYQIEFISLESLKKETGIEKISLPLTDNHQVTIEPIALSHRVSSHGFKICQTIEANELLTEKLRALNLSPSPIWGKLQGGHDVTLDTGETLFAKDFIEHKIEQTAIIVGGDNDNPELLEPYVQDVGVLVHEATYTHEIAERVKNKTDGFDPKHSSARQVAEFAQKARLPNLILTHFSGRFGLFDNANDKNPNMGHIRAEVERFYHGQFWLARDFDEYAVQQHQVSFMGNGRH